jgi:shikimate dehydrogenase
MEIDNRIVGSTGLIGLIGNPVEHTISPQLHNTISRHLGVDTIYIPFRVEKEDLERAVKGLRALNVIGFNVTVPYKKDVMKYLDENSKEALLMGAVNTVKNIGGRLYGYNTDAEGFSRSFKEESGTGFKNKKVALIGAGGAARAMSVKIALEGARRITLINRTLSKADEIKEMVNNNIVKVIESISAEDKGLSHLLQEADIVINTTSVGMHPHVEDMPVNVPMNYSKDQIFYDVIYNPVKTRFLAAAEEAGCKTINGLGMLFYQGIYAYEMWTGIKLSDDLIREFYKSFIGILP